MGTTYSDNYTKDLLDYFNAHPAKNVENHSIELKQVDTNLEIKGVKGTTEDENVVSLAREGVYA